MIVAVLSVAGCSGGDCVTNLDSACTPAYPATFDDIHQRTLAPSCAIAGGSCHATAGAQAGLALEDIDVAYKMLVTDGRVIPGDAGCSLLTMRLEGSGADVMPPGAQLRASERCAIHMWIRNGAPR